MKEETQVVTSAQSCRSSARGPKRLSESAASGPGPPGQELFQKGDGQTPNGCGLGEVKRKGDGSRFYEKRPGIC